MWQTITELSDFSLLFYNADDITGTLLIFLDAFVKSVCPKTLYWTAANKFGWICLKKWKILQYDTIHWEAFGKWWRYTNKLGRASRPPESQYQKICFSSGGIFEVSKAKCSSLEALTKDKENGAFMRHANMQYRNFRIWMWRSGQIALVLVTNPW